MTAAWVGTTTCLHLEGTEAPRVDARWADDEHLSVSYQSGAVIFRGTPQEVRLALAMGLKAIDRAVAEKAAEDDGSDWRASDAVFAGPLGEPLGKEPPR